jgi:hypothetical protein
MIAVGRLPSARRRYTLFAARGHWFAWDALRGRRIAGPLPQQGAILRCADLETDWVQRCLDHLTAEWRP